MKIYYNGNGNWSIEKFGNLTKSKTVTDEEYALLKNDMLEIQKGNLVQSRTAKLKQSNAEEEAKTGEVGEFAEALLNFFLERTLLLTDKQANILLRVETYYEKRGHFPPLPQLAQADPELWGMIAKAVEEGELPPLPQSMQLELQENA